MLGCQVDVRCGNGSTVRLSKARIVLKKIFFRCIAFCALEINSLELLGTVQVMKLKNKKKVKKILHHYS